MALGAILLRRLRDRLYANPGFQTKKALVLTQVVAGRVFDYSHSIGRYLGGMDWPGEGFVQPIATAVGEGDIVYVLSRGAESTATGPPLQPRAFGVRVGKFAIGDQAGDEEYLAHFGDYGEEQGEFVWPTGIALDSHRKVYVTDEWLHSVSVFGPDGGFLGAWGSRGSGEGELNRPSGIAIDGEANVYISDSLNHRVQVFTSDGAFLTKWGNRGSGAGQLDSPWGITTDPQGFVYVADHKNHRIQKFTPEGDYVALFGAYGTGPGQLNRPSDVAVDPDGDVYVCDWANSRVQVFKPDGGFLTSIVGDAQELSAWAKMTVDANPDIQRARRRVGSKEPEWRLAMPTGVSFDAVKSRLIVADTQRYRLQIYNKVKDYPEPQFNL